MINGKNLCQLRQLKGLTQEEAARRIGVSRSTYQRLERNPWLDGPQLQRVLTSLNCSPQDVAQVLSILN